MTKTERITLVVLILLVIWCGMSAAYYRQQMMAQQGPETAPPATPTLSLSP
jgi:hypothetical protein